MSHEKTITVGLGNKFYNIPTVAGDKVLGPDKAIHRAKSFGTLGKAYDTKEEAVKAARKRSRKFKKK